MVFINKNVVFFFLASAFTLSSAAESYLRARELTECDTLKACYLVNIQTRVETALSGSDKFELDPNNKQGYSIRCDVNGKNELDFIKFSYENKDFDEFGLPRYMNGDSNQGAYINKVDYLSTCGLKKLKIVGNVWSKPCFDKEYVIDVSNVGGKPCVRQDTSAPVKSPITQAPVKAQTQAPVKAQTQAPVKPQTQAPVKVQTGAPVKAQTGAPVKAPVKPPVAAPIALISPISAPTPVSKPRCSPAKSPVAPVVKPQTQAPVKPPVAAPIVLSPISAPINPAAPVKKPACNPAKSPVAPVVKPICTYPEQWINGSCKKLLR